MRCGRPVHTLASFIPLVLLLAAGTARGQTNRWESIGQMPMYGGNQGVFVYGIAFGPNGSSLRRQLPRRLREHGRRRLETRSPGPEARWIDSSRLCLLLDPRPTGLAEHDARGPLGRRRLPHHRWRPDLDGRVGRRRGYLDGQRLGLPAGRLCVGDARRVRRHVPIGRRRRHLECAPGARALTGSRARGRPDVERRRFRLRRRVVGRPARRGLPFDRRRRRVVPPLRRPRRRRLHGVRRRSRHTGNRVCGLE